jgi:hypothetical protein
MSAIVDGDANHEMAAAGLASGNLGKRAPAFKFSIGRWLPLTAVAVGALLSVIWTASLVGLSLWALLLLV